MPFADQPLLTLLGRRGRGAVVDALVGAPDREWSVRALARAGRVTATTASRAVRELENLGAVEVMRPGRDAVVSFRRDTIVGRMLTGMHLMDLRQAAAERFAAAYRPPAGVRAVHWWTDVPDHPAMPEVPTRIAVLCARSTDRALDAVGPALDLIRNDGFPQPDVTVWTMAELLDDDPVARAILGGRPL